MTALSAGRAALVHVPASAAESRARAAESRMVLPSGPAGVSGAVVSFTPNGGLCRRARAVQTAEHGMREDGISTVSSDMDSQERSIPSG